MSSPIETGEDWPLEKLIGVLDKSVLLSGPIGFGPILPTTVHAADYFRALDRWGPIIVTGKYPRLDFVWARMSKLRELLAEDRVRVQSKDAPSGQASKD